MPSTRRAVANAANMDRLDPTTQNVTVRYLLSFLAMRAGPDCAVTEDRVSGVEGGDHSFRACRQEYGDPAKRAFDYVDGWLLREGRFLPGR